jgi:alpha-glucosidase (family GH31 glycosyl hydrolase)
VIRHRPAGRGHPYLIEPDQRLPVRPSAGEPIELRATTRTGAGAVQAELERQGAYVRLHATARGAALAGPVAGWGARPARAAEGHLSEAAAREAVQEGRDSWSVTVAPLAHGERLRYRFHGDGGETPWFEVRGCAWEEAPAALRVEGEPRERVVPGSVSLFGDGERAYALRFALRLEPGERVVGFGERFDGLDQRGRLVDAVVFDQYKAQGARTYLPVPFAHVAGGGFGFHVDTGRRVRFDVGARDPDRILVEVDLEPGSAEPQATLRLFAGRPGDVLGAFLAATGRPAVPPPWVHRLWLSGNEWSSQARVLAEVERAGSEGIPVGVVVIEAWSDEETFAAFNGARYEIHPDGAPHRLADFDFPADGPWPDPKGLVDELHRRGIKVLLWQIPLAGSHPGQAEADAQTMVERGYCVRDGDGQPYRNPGGWFHDALLVDFTNPEARRWWTEKRRYLVEEVGVDGFKTDGGEHAWSPELAYADGTRGGETNNRWPVLYGQAYHELLRSAGREPVTFSRAGFTGAATVPCHWAGDEDSTWEAFRASISAGLTAGASGVFFWGWDLAGFSGPLPTPELYLRATAMAALCPIMQLHSEYNHHRLPSRDRTPWNVAEQSGDARVLPLFRRFARLRERLLPYLAEQAARSAATGKPLLRALFFAADRDERIWDFPEQYLLGDDLLVAPVTREGVERLEVYLPAGEWVDAWSGDRLSGPAVVERDAPLDRIPVFIVATRAGELAPLFAGLDAGATPPRVAEPAEVG